MWTYTDDYNLIPNLYIRSAFKDGELRFYQVYPCTGYVIHITVDDYYLTDYETGDLVLDENGNPILVPYYHGGGCTALKTYDWATNPKGYEAVLYEEGMEVNGNTTVKPEIM